MGVFVPNTHVRLPAWLVVLLLLLLAACSSPGTRGQRPATSVAVSPSRRPVVDALPRAPGLVWTPGKLPDALIRTAMRLPAVAAAVVVANGTAWLPTPPGGQGTSGMAIPIDVSAADPNRYAATVLTAPPELARLVAGQVALATDSARLRRLQVGASLTLQGTSLRVAAIVPDAAIGNAEMFVTPADAQRLGIPPNRYLLIRPRSLAAWPHIADRLKQSVPTDLPLRVRAPGTARSLRQADSVLAPLMEKLRFGEFAAKPNATSAGYLTIDPRWQAAHLMTVTVPILGSVTCNRRFIPVLQSALQAVVESGLQGLIHREDYGGCFAPRLIPGLIGQSISHHAYGSAIDLNAAANPLGQLPHQDPRLVGLFARFGFTWGGDWLVPDGMHFESR